MEMSTFEISTEHFGGDEQAVLRRVGTGYSQRTEFLGAGLAHWAWVSARYCWSEDRVSTTG